MHNRELHWIANDQRLAKGAEGADPQGGDCSLGAALMGLLAHLTRDPDS